MHDIESALDDISRIRDQLAASTRFQGIAPSIVALSGLLAFVLATWQVWTGSDDLIVWMLLAGICAAMIGTEAVVRARKRHRSMADRLLNMTLQRFLPTMLAGAVVALVLLTRVPEQARLLPGLWQLLMGVGTFAAIGNLPRQVSWAGLFYLVAGALSLVLGADADLPTALLMGLPFGFGQLLVAGLLHHAANGAP